MTKGHLLKVICILSTFVDSDTMNTNEKGKEKLNIMEMMF